MLTDLIDEQLLFFYFIFIYSVCWGQIAATFCLQNTNFLLAVSANMCIS